MPKEFLSNDIAHPHHRKAIWTGVLAVIIFGAFIWGYVEKTKVEVLQTTPQERVLTLQEQMMTATNPPEELTAEDEALRTSMQNQENPPKKSTEGDEKVKEILQNSN